MPALHRGFEAVDQVTVLRHDRTHVGTQETESLHRRLRSDRCGPDRAGKCADVAHERAAPKRIQHTPAGSAAHDLDFATADQVGVVALLALAQQLVPFGEPHRLELGRELVDRARRQVGEGA